MAELFIILTLLLLLITTPSHSINHNHTDIEALIAFKNSIQEDPLGSLSSWNKTTSFCRWNGVSCSKRHPNRVVSLSLRSQALVGSLSPHLGNLSFLRTIILQNNSFYGPIPEEIGRLRRLQVIELSNNSLGGEIPRNLSKCTNVYYLNLIDNELTGEIGHEIGSLVNLQDLGLSRNLLLSGTIPPSLGNLTNLIQLSLANCGLHGEIPQSLGRLGRMRWLYLDDNSLTGWIPSSLYNLSSIEILALGTNRLSGTIPSLSYSNLRFLDLGENHFIGALPPWLSNSSLIEHISLSSNNFTGNMIDLTRLFALEGLEASTNYFNGDIHTILTSLTNCTALTRLTLGDNLLTGSLPDSIGNLSTHLFAIVIDLNQISGPIPSTIANLVGLSVLLAEVNDLQGPIPSSIGELGNLQIIDLGENRLTNEIPSSFGNLTLLNHLILKQNNLSGSIPQSLGNCSDLLRLDLSRNNLNGSIPREIMRLSSISITLDLSYNVLLGSIPSEVGDLRNLGALDLSHNRLSGTLPNSLSSCVMLVSLYLDSNFLQGEIPDSLRALRGLLYLDLSRNNISGTIPSFLLQFQMLYLNISFNALQGEVPSLGVFKNESAVSLQGNRDLCGGIAIFNLPSCSSTNPNKKSGFGKKILIPTTAGAICLVFAACFCFCVIMYRRRTSQKVVNPGGILSVPEFLRLSYADLLNATAGFLESNLVGAGRFGSVYKGSINNDDGNEERVVAVKVLNLNIRGAFKSLESECKALRGIRHRNLLKIVSVCDSSDFRGTDFKALVYEYMANGSLENWLHHNSEEHHRILTTIQRLNIAIDIASAVEYLHCGTDSVVIHGDLKPSNILLDQDMVAKVGDFGLAKVISSISHNLSSVEGSSSTAIKGTIGYMAPEYGMNGVASTQGDAYSYGVLVLEMFTNRRPTSSDAFGNLHDFVSHALPNHVMGVVDPFLHQHHPNGGDKYWDCIASILKIGVRCSMELPSDRMSMAEVVIDLKRIRSVLAVDRRGRN